ncbi:hypothetical protein TNCV_3131451 [Trichonephila clavipes]|nr:hypothetical protein TNCV_3131451 [Trichonephila clavipes]
MYTEDLEPEFTETIPNVTVATGQEAVLSCAVDNLGTYRLQKSTKSKEYFWWISNPGPPPTLEKNICATGHKRTVLKFGKRIPLIEYRSAAKWVLSKSTPKWRCRELSGVIGN